METKIERLKKLRELALRGVGGEREAAIKLLAKLEKKYGLSSEELDEETEREFEFSFHGEFEKSLIAQIAYKVTDRMGAAQSLYYTRSGRKCRTCCAVTCTEAQKLEIEFLFDFYKALWKKEVDFLLQAFIQKHKLFGKLKDGEKGEELTIEEMLKMQLMMNGLSDDSPLRRITDGK